MKSLFMVQITIHITCPSLSVSQEQNEDWLKTEEPDSGMEIVVYLLVRWKRIYIFPEFYSIRYFILYRIALAMS